MKRGDWNEGDLTMLVSRPARTTEIWPGQARLVKGEQIALFNVDSQFFALDNTCTHRGGPLADGEVTCPGTAPHSTFGRAKS
jgi:Rieske [2Fe-2S] domain